MDSFITTKEVFVPRTEMTIKDDKGKTVVIYKEDLSEDIVLSGKKVKIYFHHKSPNWTDENLGKETLCYADEDRSQSIFKQLLSLVEGSRGLKQTGSFKL